MKILHVKGDDFIALEAEDYGIDKLAKAVLKGKPPKKFSDCEIIDIPGDPPSNEFIDWIKNEICDYDQLKHFNFYIIDE